MGLIDLSKATGLKDVAFVWKCDPRWVVAALRTVTRDHKNLQRISVETYWNSFGTKVDSNGPAEIRKSIGETVWRGWSELGGVLAQLWESH